jgi:hypothetical protein
MLARTFPLLNFEPLLFSLSLSLSVYVPVSVYVSLFELFALLVRLVLGWCVFVLLFL